MILNEKTRLTEDRAKDVCTPTSKSEKRLVFVLFIIFILGLSLCVLSTAYYRSEFYRSQTNNICLTKECISTASRLLKSIDFDQKPCEDFYSFVCNNWIKNSHLVNEMVISQFSRLNTIIILRIKEFLELETSNLPEHAKKVKDFYNACLHRDNKDEEGNKALLDDLKSFGGWPLIEKHWNSSSFDWVDLTGQLFEKGYPYDLLLSVGVDRDIKNTSSSLLVVDHASLGLNDRSYYLFKTDKTMDNYKDLILSLAYYFEPNLDIIMAMELIEYSISVEQYLAKSIPSERDKLPDNYYNIMTLNDIEDFAPKIPWRKLLKKLLPSNESINNTTRIMVVSPSTLNDLNKMLLDLDNPTGKAILANYMLYRTVLSAAEHLGKDVFTLIEEEMHHTCHRSLWQVCASSTVDLFHMSLTATYADSYMDNETKPLLEMMFEDIKATMLEDIKTAEWLDEETRKKAMLKVSKACSTIAYRDEMQDDTKLNDYYKPIKIGGNPLNNVKEAYKFYAKESLKGLNEGRVRFKWTDTTNLLRANAFYQPSQNSIIIPIGLLQDVFFSKGRPNYINYGSLGTILGHEYTHAFDSLGSLYDEEGNYRMWWTNESWDNFQERTKCYMDQYDKYYEPTVKTHMNGTITLSENLADNGGLRMAYQAYNKLLERIGNEDKLPGLPFTERQMFWISFASAWCRKQTNHTLKYVIENSVHAPSNFRVIGALSNMPEFSRDFNCKEGSALNPPTKCHLWK